VLRRRNLPIPERPVQALEGLDDHRPGPVLGVGASAQALGGLLGDLHAPSEVLPVEDGAYLDARLLQQLPEQLVAVGEGGDLGRRSTVERSQGGADQPMRLLDGGDDAADRRLLAAVVDAHPDQHLVVTRAIGSAASDEGRVEAEVDRRGGIRNLGTWLGQSLREAVRLAQDVLLNRARMSASGQREQLGDELGRGAVAHPGAQTCSQSVVLPRRSARASQHRRRVAARRHAGQPRHAKADRAEQGLHRPSPVILQPQRRVIDAHLHRLCPQGSFLDGHERLLEVAEQPLRRRQAEPDLVDMRRRIDLAKLGNPEPSLLARRARLHQFERPAHRTPPASPRSPDISNGPASAKVPAWPRMLVPPAWRRADGFDPAVLLGSTPAGRPRETLEHVPYGLSPVFRDASLGRFRGQRDGLRLRPCPSTATLG
jgi:hypothetical protein